MLYIHITVSYGRWGVLSSGLAELLEKMKCWKCILIGQHKNLRLRYHFNISTGLFSVSLLNSINAHLHSGKSVLISGTLGFLLFSGILWVATAACTGVFIRGLKEECPRMRTECRHCWDPGDIPVRLLVQSPSFFLWGRGICHEAKITGKVTNTLHILACSHFRYRFFFQVGIQQIHAFSTGLH